jgi:hypothetical protein
LRRIRRFAVQIVLVGVLATAGVVTAAALAGGTGANNTTTKHGTGGGRHNTGTDETTTPDTGGAPPPPASAPPPPVDPTKSVTTTDFGTNAAKASAKKQAHEDLGPTTSVMAMMCGGALLTDLALTGKNDDAELILYALWFRLACQDGIAQVFALNAIIKDPPDPNFGQVAFPAPTAPPLTHVSCSTGVARAVCARLTARALAYVRALDATTSAAAGLVTSLNRFASATAAGSADGRLLQAGAAKAYAGELASALSVQHQAGRALAAVLHATRSDGRLGPASRASVLKRLSSTRPLPTWLTRAPAASGAPASALDLRKALITAITALPKTLSVAAAVAPGSPPVGFTQLQHSLTVYELAAVVRALANQGAIAHGTGETLLGDLRTALTATTASARTAAFASFSQHAAVAQPAPEALLTAAAQALS